MNDLVEWLGKAEELSITYEAGIYQAQMLQGGVDLDAELPAIIYSVSENVRDVVEVVWEEDIKKADRIDYMMAVCSGTISGLIDAFYIGEFSLERANKWGTEEVNRFVKKVARLQGFNGDDLSDAIRYLEKNSGFAADTVTPVFGGGLQHHLRDFSHHFSLGGLLCSLYTQFSGKVIGTNTLGELRIVELTDKTFIGRNFEEKVLFGTVNWFFHMVSDMAGSSAAPGKGTGIPGPLVSLIKEISTLPCFREKRIGEHEFHVWVSKLFNGTLLAKRDENGKIVETLRFDLRTEIGILHEVRRQFVPVLINECLVRGLYFIRRLYNAIKETEIYSITGLFNINKAELLPFNNRVIKRMVTIASGTFSIIDIVDAAVCAAIKSKGIIPAFFVDFAVRINIVGIGRFIIACKADWKFITEDIRKAKEKRDKIEKEYERLISDFRALSLSYEQMRVLSSIQRMMIADDIAITKDDADKKQKIQWKANWEKELLESLSFASGTVSEFFLSEPEVVEFINSSDSGPWQYLVAMEAMLYTPYYPLTGNGEKKKEQKKLKFKSKYLMEYFPGLQDKITKRDLFELKRAYKSAVQTITGSKKNMIIGAVGTTAAIVVTGGLAFNFAPAIATAIVGESAAGLSGAALLNYSLAAIGGGSLAAGGFGMAGGTAIITGGGAFIGMTGGTGISAITTVNLLADDGYVLSECCKLLSFSKEVLVKKYNDFSAVKGIYFKVESRTEEVQRQIDLFAELADIETDEKRKKENKIKAKVAKKSLRYLKSTAAVLEKLAKGEVEDDQLAMPEGNRNERLEDNI
ncbi:MAG: hypothetical protein Q4D71_07275 [Oscillospiraceae bacterium]|nr:hypothetical protein [Oscillospiraceae bacterium]